MNPQVEYYLSLFRKGRGDAFFGLIEANSTIIPDLIDTYRVEPDASVRELLVEVVWQHRQASTIPFLGEALHDAEPVVWKQAIDGLVSLGRSRRSTHCDLPKVARFRAVSTRMDFAIG
jgi:hypothetical protein